MSDLNFAIDCRMSSFSGIGTYIRELVPRIIKFFPELDFLLLGYQNDMDLASLENWSAREFEADIYTVKEQLIFRKVLKNVDILWSPHYNISLLSPCPFFVTIHDLAHLSLRDTFGLVHRLYAKLFMKRAQKKAEDIFFISEFTKKEFLKHIGPTGGQVIYNGVNLSSLSERNLDLGTNKKFFLSIGNLKSNKNIGFLCRSFAQIVDKCNANLHIIGEYKGFRTGGVSKEELENICPGRIIFHGKVSSQYRNQALSEALALIAPSSYEGFGLPPLEALSVGTPVICSDIPVFKEVYSEAVSFFKLENTRELASLMLEIYNMPAEELKKIKIQGKVHAAKFSWDISAEKIARSVKSKMSL